MSSVSMLAAVHAAANGLLNDPSAAPAAVTPSQQQEDIQMADTVTPAALSAGTAITTSAQLAAAYPDLCAQIRSDGATAERERLAGIDRISAGVDASVIAEMKSDPSVTPEKAAFRILEASQAKRSTVMASIQAVEDVTRAVTASATTAGGGEPPKQSAHELAAKARTYQDEQAHAGNRISTAQAVAHVERNG